MASAIPPEISVHDDDDDFDWEAAVKQIDVACESRIPSSSSLLQSSNDIKKKPAFSGQSTLHKFLIHSNVITRNEPPLDVQESVSLIDIDAEAAKTWIYPVNVPPRDYQLTITKTALFSNTLVALPTGLGKTLIAAVVMYNYFRWFPEGKIVFAAPSRPLVLQQIEACHNIVGIPQEWTIDMTGLINPAKRVDFWKSKRVFFVTPQVLEKDIQSGACLVKYLVCLVIDEAHRALGNYSYCVVIRELMMVPVPLRILALTATPGSKQQGIQQIIDNLHISTLEYRDESDHDVRLYVHDRKIELIQVAMGEEAIEINNKLLEIIRPLVARLSSMGILLNRDYKTLSPCDLLNSRDKFRQTPPPDNPHIKYQDVEGLFGVLITLYHIRKLLSSHGIRPASEMLEDKLQQGSFARFMSKNDHICKMRLIMQRSLSHGAPSPKLSKMMEVLVNHFKTKDPQDSRVIIFSNFRGSVRDIMDALTKIRDVVRATEFIGQSSGKSLKGQSQRVQQAVLEKFRTGGYNVIVATSIGEEGLDIMEVDLVICFDANISPIRMIQRMGRTGRKHDGRVVVLACEGSEMKGYTRKQTSSKSIKKHMQNGGINSFKFHASPRLVPHTIKPEVQFVELAIKQFVRPGKKVRDDHGAQTKLFHKKLTDDETKLLLKYFHPFENTWKPSLIAFPRFQTFPSRTHRVLHSSRTMVLLNTMRELQGLHFSGDIDTFSVEEKSCIRELFEGRVEQCDGSKRGSLHEVSASKAEVERPLLYPEVSSSINTAEKQCGKVLSSCFKHGAYNVGTSVEDLIVQTKSVKPTTSQTKYSQDEILSSPETDGINVLEDELTDQTGKIHRIALKRNFSNGDNVHELPAVKVIKTELLLADESGIIENQLSPRLTNLVESGFVPDSPIDDCGNSDGQRICESAIPQFIGQVGSEVLLKSSTLGDSERINCNDSSFAGADFFLSSDQIQTPLLKDNNNASVNLRAPTSSVVDKTQTPLAILASSNNSEDWHLVIEEKSSSVKKPRKFKRLQKVGDMKKDTSVLPLANTVGSISSTRHIKKKKRDGERRLPDNVRTFIEEEAEIASDATISDDEEDDDKVKSSLDSFIDDRFSASATSTQDDLGRLDMMAIYRRSLLSQSPFERLTENRPGVENIDQSPAMHSESIRMNHSQEVVTTGVGVESRKRKLTCGASESVPKINLERKLSFEVEVRERESVCEVEANWDVFDDDDDEFYEGLDLDAVEAQATLLLKKKVVELTTQSQPQSQPQPHAQQQKKFDLITSPSFDLGI